MKTSNIMREEARDKIVLPIEQRMKKNVSIIVEEMTRLETNCEYIYNASWISFFVKEAFRISFFTSYHSEEESENQGNWGWNITIAQTA